MMHCATAADEPKVDEPKKRVDARTGTTLKAKGASANEWPRLASYFLALAAGAPAFWAAFVTLPPPTVFSSRVYDMIETTGSYRRPTKRAAADRTAAALPPILIAPLLVVLGVAAPDPEVDGVVELFVDVVFAAVALAAVWNIVKFFAAVGLTAKTIPFEQ